MLARLVLATLSTLVVNEVLYDPDGADGGREFVEIMNTGAAPVPLAGLELQVGDGARLDSWQTVWRGAVDSLAPAAFVVVGGDSVERRTHALGGSLQNGPDALRLWRDGTTLDRVGYGALENPAYYEGAPAADVTGASLARIPDGVDTDHNAHDFRAAASTPGRRNLPRRALALALVPPAPARLWPYRPLEVLARVHNRGMEPFVADSVALRAELRSVSGEPYRDTVLFGGGPEVRVHGGGGAVAPGDSATYVLGWTGVLGLFRLDVEVRGGTDDGAPRSDSLWVRCGAGPVLIQEIMFAPAVGALEWIEIVNRDVRAHPLTGWTLADAGGRAVLLRAGGPLAAGAVAVCAADTTTAIPGLPAAAPRVAVSPWPALNNSDDPTGVADVLVLRDRRGIVQDAVAYSAAGVERGRSLERLTADPDARGLLWASSKDPSGATPGRANSASAPPGWSTDLVLQPNPFSPDGDGHEDLLTIALEVPAAHAGFEVALYDASGRRRRFLGGDRLGPGPRRMAWDGHDDAGTPLESGVYILRLELVGGTRSTQLRTVGLVRR